MKEYKDLPEKEPHIVSEPAVAYDLQYGIAQPYPDAVREFKIPRDENGKPIGHTLDEVFDAIDLDWSETSGIDFVKLTRMLNSGELHIDDVTDEMLHSTEFKYEPYLRFKPQPRKKVEFSSEWLAAMKDVFENE